MAKSRKLHLEFGNYICRFGDKYELLDFATEIVIPAFRSESTRKFGPTSYHIIDARLVQLDRDEVGLAFEFVKATKLTRQQRLERRKIVPDKQTIDSAPSAQGLLILSNHKLIFLPMTPSAPTLKELESTTQHLISAQRKIYIHTRLQTIRRRDRVAARASLEATIPEPTVTVVPLTSEESIKDSIVRFKTIHRFTVELVDPNNELETDDFFEQFQAQKKSIGAKTTKLVHTNKQVGLNKAETEKEIASATKTGNTKVTVDGKDHEDEDLSQKNEQLRVRHKFDEQVADLATNARHMFNHYGRLVANGILSLSRTVGDTKQKAKDIFEQSRKEK